MGTVSRPFQSKLSRNVQSPVRWGEPTEVSQSCAAWRGEPSGCLIRFNSLRCEPLGRVNCRKRPGSKDAPSEAWPGRGGMEARVQGRKLPCGFSGLYELPGLLHNRLQGDS